MSEMKKAKFAIFVVGLAVVSIVGYYINGGSWAIAGFIGYLIGFALTLI
jgi:hypothetical protein